MVTFERKKSHYDCNIQHSISFRLPRCWGKLDAYLDFCLSLFEHVRARQSGAGV
jgi:hypothetical protein